MSICKVQDKFCLHLTEEQAVHYFQSLIDESVNAQFAVMVEKIHKWAQVSKMHKIILIIYFTLLFV